MSLLWHFPSTDGGDDDGINDAGLEQFEGNREKTVARECIQNSLDARDNNSEPVRVEFDVFSIDSYLIPGAQDLGLAMEKAKEYAAGHAKVEKMYDEALESLRKPKMQVLRVGDYNTTGLTGGDTRENAGGWYYLVRSNGSSSKTADGGGSFGIGKSAPFAASSIRTVFYSTMTEDGGVAFQGKTRISSFMDESGDIHRGIGQYGREKERGVSSIRNREEIPDIFERREQGTDVFVIGYRISDDWKKRIIEAVVESFYVAVAENTLEVVVKDTESEPIVINAQSLAGIVERFVTDEDVRLYYNTFVDENHRYFSEKIFGLGQVEMYVRLGEGRKHVQGMRKTLMKVHEFNRLRTLNEEFTGIVIVRGDEGNNLLRNLEPPSHDEWDKERGDKRSQNALKRLREWVVGNLRQIASEKLNEIEEIPDLSKYLPQDLADDDRDPIFANNGSQSYDDKDPNETAAEHGTTEQNTPPISINIKDRQASITRPGTSGGAEKKIGTQGDKKKKPSKVKGVLPGQGNTNFADTSDMDIRVKETFKDGKRVYSISITPTKNDDGDIRIIGIGDGANYPLDVASATTADGKQLKVQRERIKGLSFEADKTIVLDVDLKSTRRYIVGVS